MYVCIIYLYHMVYTYKDENIDTYVYMYVYMYTYMYIHI